MIMDKVDVYMEQAKSKIASFTNTGDWFNADIFGKAKIAWDELIGNPLGEWWNSSGKSAFSGIAKSIGSGLGSVLSTGLMSLLGIDISSAASEGMSIGASFAEGFASKFDLGEIISKAVKSHPIISSLIGLKMGSSILGAGKSVFSTGKSIVGGIGVLGAGIASAFSSYKNGGVKSVLSNLKTIFTGSGTGSAVGNALSTVSAMTITAGVVNLNGSVANAATSGQSGYYQVRRARASAQNAETLAQNAPVPTPSLGKYVIQDKAGNTIGGTNSFMQAGLAKTGVFLGSGATTVGGAALAGTAGIAGAVVAGGTVLSAVSDFYHAEKSNNAEEKAAYNASSSVKLGGVAAGAATGAAIGSVIPVVGTVIGGLVGAGIGGLAGSAIGNNMKKSFEKAKVESEELKAAIDDDEASAEDLQRALESACSQNLRKHFGNIKLTLQEISTAAKDITLGSKVKEFEKFSEAVNSVEQSYEGLSSAQKDLEKSVWKINVGVQFEEEDYTNFKQEIDNFISYGKEYLTDNQLEFQASVNLLLGDNGTGYKAYDGVNWMYTKLQNEFSENKLKFEQEYEVALKDGKIDKTEMTSLQQYIDKQNSITEKISDAQNKAENEFTKQKFLGGSLSYDSFEELRGELKTNLESGIQTYDDAYKDTLENLYYALADGTIDDSQFQEMIQAALNARNSGVLSIRDNIKTVELDSFTEAYSKALDGVLPNLTGTTSEKLSQFLSKTNIQPLDTETIIEKLGLTNSNLSTEAQENIAGILKNIQLDLSVGDLLRPNGDTAAALSTQVENLIGSAFTGDFSAFANSVGTAVGNSINNNIGSANASISSAKDKLNENIQSILGEKTTVTKNVDINWNITNPNPPSLGGSSGDNSSEPNIVEKASGGFVNSATRFIAGEAGTEVIIPLSSSRRNRGIDLWEKAGKMLGVPYFADGGFVSGAYNNYSGENMYAISDDDIDNDNDIPVFAEQNGQSINITIGANPAITINSDGGNVDILQVLKENLSDIADDILEQVAEALEGIFKNRPREA